MQWLQQQLDEAAELFQIMSVVSEHREALHSICERLIETLEEGGKLLTLGNGGSAADALHLAEEMLGRYRGERESLPAVCLSADGTALTCIANDYGFERIFSRQIESLGKQGDAVIAFSTSGNSANIVTALEAAQRIGATTIGLLGCDGGRARGHCDLALVVPHENTARIQEVHGLALHVICEAFERRWGLPD